MSDITEDLDWDSVLEGVAEDEKENPGGGSDFEAIPNGDYPVVVQESDKQVSGSGNDMIKVKIRITEGPYVNRVLFSYIVFSKGSPKGMRITLDKLAAFGVTRDSLALSKPSIPEIASMLIGRQALAKVAIQDSGEYKGRNEVKGFKPIEGLVQDAPQVAAAAKPGVPNIPTPSVPTEAPAAAPAPPVPQVPVAQTGSAEDPFEG